MECRSFLEKLESLIRYKVDKSLKDQHSRLSQYQIDDLVRLEEEKFAEKLFHFINTFYNENGEFILEKEIIEKFNHLPRGGDDAK